MKYLAIIIILITLLVGSVHAQTPEPTPEFADCATFHPFTQLAMQNFYARFQEADFSEPDEVEALSDDVLDIENGVTGFVTDEQCDYLRELLIDTLHGYAKSFAALAEASRTERDLLREYSDIERGLTEPRPES